MNLLARSGEKTSFWHIWAPQDVIDDHRKPIRIPSDVTVHDAVHIGVTSLNHSHFIGVKSSAYDPPELWVISHSPYDDPADNFEQIRLTWIGNETSCDFPPVVRNIDIQTINELNSTVHSRVYLPWGSSPHNVPVLVMINGEGWRDEFNPNLDPVRLGAEQVAVITINPTGSLGYGHRKYHPQTAAR